MNIYLGNAVIGQATVTIDGLYAKIRCVCQLSDNKLYALYLQSKTENRLLGTAVPQNSCHFLEVKLPKKYIANGDFHLHAAEKYTGNEVTNILLEPGKPIASIGILDRLRYRMHGDRSYLLCVRESQ